MSIGTFCRRLVPMVVVRLLKLLAGIWFGIDTKTKVGLVRYL